MPWLQAWPRKWPDLSLRTKCLLLISFPAAATVLMFGMANILAARNSAAAERVNLALGTGQEIQRLRAAETETSADARAYVITAQESFVAQARSAIAAFDAARQQLFNLTADYPVQQQRLAEIAALEHAREERMFGDIARFRAGELPGDQLREAVIIRRRYDYAIAAVEREHAGIVDLAADDRGQNAYGLLAESYGAAGEICHHLGQIRPKRLILTHMSNDMLARRAELSFETAEDGMVVEL